MPTPAICARQCLSEEAAKVLDEAMAVAKRRNHAQTTSLHVVSALLSLPSSGFREACVRSGNGYSNRLHCKALELCFSVALDRLPSSSSSSSSSQSDEQPPVSNSLMAAIKRSQANQRRSCGDTHYQNFQQQQQQLQQQQQSLMSVKVDFQQLILSILDDPAVSRVMSDAGFFSNDVKLAVQRPPLRFTRGRCPPLFLCNFTGPEFEWGYRNFPNFGFGRRPFSDFSDENLRRTVEVLMRKKKRNPLLVGGFGSGLIENFVRSFERSSVPEEVSGLKFVCIESQVRDGKYEGLVLKLKEVEHMVESCSGPGVLVSVGDLKELLDRSASENAKDYVVSELTRLVRACRRLWLIGVATSFDTYLKFQACYPSIESDWDLQPLPITSLSTPPIGLYSRPTSLMESFVPFGGFFATASDWKGPLNSTYQSTSHCHLCNEKYEQEVATVLKECPLSVADQDESRLPSWLQRAKVVNTSKGVDFPQAKDGGLVLNAKVVGLKRKWDDICQRHHNTRILELEPPRKGPTQGIPGTLGHPYAAEREREDTCNDKNVNGAQNQSGWVNVFPVPMDLKKKSLANQTMPTILAFDAENRSSLPKLQQVKPTKSEKNHSENFQFHPCASSVTTDLALGRFYSKEHNKQAVQTNNECSQGFTGCMPAEIDTVDQTTSMSSSLPESSSLDSAVVNINFPLRSSPSQQVCVDVQTQSSCNPSIQCDPSFAKTLYRGLVERVGRQDEAIRAISWTVVRCKMGKERLRGASLRGDIWLNFMGMDRVGKKKAAAALADIVFGSGNNFIYVDLSSQDGVSCSNLIFGCQEINGYELRFRGKTTVDHIAGEISKKQLSVVFLDNIDKADLLVQDSLSQAIRTGRFSDSHGREISINNAIFVTAAVTEKGRACFLGKESVNFSEERILATQRWKMQILVVDASKTTSSKQNVLVTKQNEFEEKQDFSGHVFVNKSKLNGANEQHETLETTERMHKKSSSYLDLNLSIEEMEANNDSDENDENTENWMNEFFSLVDETVVFRPFDFDGLADNILKEITGSFLSIIGSEALLEIDLKVMEQILAAVWLSDGKGAFEDWVKHVLGTCFVQACKKYSLSSHSILKLVTCENLFMEEQAPGVCLPAKIILN